MTQNNTMTTLFTVSRVTVDVLTDVLTINHSILGSSELIPQLLEPQEK